MLAETYIALDAHMVETLGLDDAQTDRIESDTFVAWRGFTTVGAVQFDLQLSPAFDKLSVTLYDDDIEQELATASTASPSVAWVTATLDKWAAGLLAN
jgi:hypothetical protein